MTAATPPRAVLYSRLSKESAVSTSISGQGESLFALAEREGWDIVATFVDEGLSGGKRRAAADESLRMLRDGEADILAAYSVDRYSRQGVGEDGEVVRVIRRGAAEAARQPGMLPPRVVFMREGIDSATDPTSWAMRFGLASELAYGERELIRTRQVAARDRMRRQGRNAGHGVPPFGYRTGPHPTLPVGRGLHPIPEEAAIIREVAERVIAEESMVNIAADLTARRVPTAHSPARLAALAQDARDRGDKTDKTNLRGAWLLDTDPTTVDAEQRAKYWDADGDGWTLRTGHWTQGRIRTTWTSDHLLGRISHKGAPVYGDDGTPLAPFAPVLSLDVLLDVRARFDGSSRRTPNRRAAYLLSGVAYCAACDGKLYPRMTGAGGRYLSYACSTRSLGGTCAQPVSMSARKLEGRVINDYLLSRGNAPELALDRPNTKDDATLELIELEARLKETATRWTQVDDDAEEATLVAAMRSLRARREALRTASIVPTTVLRATGRTMGEAWHATDNLITRRRLLLDVMDHVVVFPASAADRVAIRWIPSPSEYPTIEEPTT